MGAGPAGIAVVGKLLDHGVKNIGWIDPHFTVGDLSQKWSLVPSNTRVALFRSYLEGCESFEYQKHPLFRFDSLDGEENCLLRDVVEPLQWVSDRLRKRVFTKQGTAIALNLARHLWEVKTQEGSFFGKKVVLAIGSDPKILPFSGPEVVALDVALNPEKLVQVVGPQDTVAVFGSSHSAMLALANLTVLPVQVINFYRSPHRYAIYLKDWILFDATGLKGFSADWARKYIDGVLPVNLKRVLVSEHTFEESLALCSKVVYATGFERRKLPVLEQFEDLRYDGITGLIAPGLFGLGIAFPQIKFNRLGHAEELVGLWKFMNYLNEMMPYWLK